ncbi:MAG: helix-turn-helix domain-containing protein [Lentisphaeria bacterium]|nr:helix-turn-helix domain-containing protein [Lentisphaeria bacterium]
MIDLFENDDEQKKSVNELDETKDNLINPVETPNLNEIISENINNENAVETTEVIGLEDDDFLVGKIDEDIEENNSAQNEQKIHNSYFAEKLDNEKSSEFKIAEDNESERVEETIDDSHPYQSTFETLNINELDKIKRANITLDYDNFGESLRRLREAANIDYSIINQSTHIPIEYLIALEHEDYANLPREVYIVAYIRKLGTIYRLTEEEICSLSKKVKNQMDHDLPEENDDKIIMEHETSEENIAKLKKIMLWFGIIVFAIIVLIVGIIVFVRQKGDTVYHKSFRSEDIIDIQKSPELEKYVLPANR